MNYSNVTNYLIFYITSQYSSASMFLFYFSVGMTELWKYFVPIAVVFGCHGHSFHLLWCTVDMATAARIHWVQSLTLTQWESWSNIQKKIQSINTTDTERDCLQFIVSVVVFKNDSAPVMMLIYKNSSSFQIIKKPKESTNTFSHPLCCFSLFSQASFPLYGKPWGAIWTSTEDRSSE